MYSVYTKFNSLFKGGWYRARSEQVSGYLAKQVTTQTSKVPVPCQGSVCVDSSNVQCMAAAEDS